MGLLHQISSHTPPRESTDGRTLQGLSLAVLRVQYLANQRFGIAYTIYRSRCTQCGMRGTYDEVPYLIMTPIAETSLTLSANAARWSASSGPASGAAYY